MTEREIKFRCWDKIYEKMWYWRIGNQEFDLAKELLNNDSIVMQFTGLKDMNNIDIYDGDIITWKEKKTGVVIFNPRKAWYLYKYSYNIFNLVWRKDSKVIGNRYQNDTLLKLNFII